MVEIYLFIEFEWPNENFEDMAKAARKLHDVTQDSWLKEIVAASRGIGGKFPSVWVFHLKNYAALDRLYSGEDEISKAFLDFHQYVPKSRNWIREKVTFL